MLKPKYSVFDESSAMLDINGKETIYGIIKKLKREGTGIIFITNSLEEIKLADKVLVIDNKTIYKYSKKEILNNKEILKRHELYNSLLDK